MLIFFCLLLALLVSTWVQGFNHLPSGNLIRPKIARHQQILMPTQRSSSSVVSKSQLSMNFFDDAFRFFSNLNKEASARHILMSGPDASSKLRLLKEELEGAADVQAAFSELATKVSECPSASRGGNLGTFKPGMMVKEFDKVCFEKEVGVVHGPIETQFGSHLILVTRRYEGENEKKK